MVRKLIAQRLIAWSEEDKKMVDKGTVSIRTIINLCKTMATQPLISTLVKC